MERIRRFILSRGGGPGGAGPEKRDGERRRPTKHVIPWENVVANERLGTGEFGVVQQGVWNDEGRSVQVAIKRLYKERMRTDAIDFLKEAAIVHDIDHENVVRLYGVVLHPDELMLVTELAPLRSLLECLHEPKLRPVLTVSALCEFCVQIARGMAHLESRRLIHRDLAARNVLVFAKNLVKISDFGLSRALGQGEDYYRTEFNADLKLPIAWCAPECIAYLKFTSASDAWAFGVTAWEMFSYGFRPWAALNGREILAAVDEPSGQRLERPERCPEEHYALMLECWAHEPERRPKFAELVRLLDERRPERVRVTNAKRDSSETLAYRVGDVVTVLDKDAGHFWKGVLDSGAVGRFDPSNTISHLGASPPNGTFARTHSERSSHGRRKLCGDMISTPQGEVRHTGHIGLDGARFGDVSFLKRDRAPRQAVAPYRPSDDLEQMPLIDPNSPSHLTATTPIERTSESENVANGTSTTRFEWPNCTERAEIAPAPPETDQPPHDYQEIAEEEDPKSASDFMQSLLDEMESILGKYGERSSSRDDKSTSKSKKKATVKPISAHDRKTLDSAIALANELTEKSMAYLAGEEPPKTPTSPVEKSSKFSFLFPRHSHSAVNGGGHHKGSDGQKVEKRNFSQEAQSVPDIQTILTEESKKAYESLVEQPNRSETATLLKIKQKGAAQLHLDGKSDKFHDFDASKLQNDFDMPKETKVKSVDATDGCKSFADELNRNKPINALPLPPKDPTKHWDTGKRHVRKHPLILQNAETSQNGSKFNNNILESNDLFYPKSNECLLPEKAPEHFNNFDAARRPDVSNFGPSLNPFDAHSLNFECQIENDLDSADCCDGFVYDFDDFERRLSIGDGRHSTSAFEQPPRRTFDTFKTPNSRPPTRSAYENQAIHFIDDDTFASLESPGTECSGFSEFAMKHSPDRVSVEDLLEFADQKPCGRQRGVDSDEVRIMCKVLNQQIAPESCLLALEFAAWNVHRAIKLARLKFMGLDSPTLYECSAALDACEWDVARAAAMLADSSDVAQV